MPNVATRSPPTNVLLRILMFPAPDRNPNPITSRDPDYHQILTPNAFPPNFVKIDWVILA